MKKAQMPGPGLLVKIALFAIAILIAFYLIRRATGNSGGLLESLFGFL